MKLFIASDIHGSGKYVKLLEERFNESKCDKLILLGDLLYHGPRNKLPIEYDPEVVYTTLNKYKDRIMAVRGNCDSEVDQMVLEFPIMDDYLFLNIDNHNIYFSHGHINERINYDDNDILINGHTHVYVLSKNYINVGSISIPKNNTLNSYVIYEDSTFYLYDLITNNLIDKIDI